MEFTHGRGDGFYSKDDDDSKHPPFVPSSSSSSSPSSSCTASRWTDVASGSGGGGGDAPNVEKEHMFDKVVTPSDVGKLNRLVIPKQHAERYFPLDASANEKGLLLCFEDRTGKSWRFRYSYWNSSQSYVMTKGWSRFVKEKRLDAGDTVSFCRGVGEAGRDRLFIDWRRRPEAHDPPRLPLPLPLPLPVPLSGVSLARSVGPWSSRLLIPPAGTVHDYGRQVYGYNAASPGSGQFLFFRSSAAGPPQLGVQPGGGDRAVAGVPMVLDSVPLVHAQATPKRVRLFGVDLNCPQSDGGADSGSGPSLSMRQMRPRSTLPLLERSQGGPDSSRATSSPGKEQQ